MPLVPLKHTDPPPSNTTPSAERKLRLVARDLIAHQVLKPHSHPWGQLTYARDGMLHVIADNSTWFVPPLRAIWIPPNMVHEIRTMETAQLRALYTYAGYIPFPIEHCIVLEVSPLLRELIHSVESLDEPGPREDHLVQVILDELVHAETLPMHLAMPRDKRLKSLCESLIAEPSSTLTLEDFAQQVGASARTLSRLFEQDLGLSFGQWRQQMRLTRATSLIASGLPLSRVASELGYTSQSAFSAMFKKTFGKSPSAFYQNK
ncbi:AraC family transcriptional regulator [Undibacterium sp. TJN25]|uniref:AraC family transcriptional regulator n=1 Tax=Undibacterium sp. TJN25 TaxID=3413056 RepID=UPI003BF17579